MFNGCIKGEQNKRYTLNFVRPIFLIFISLLNFTLFAEGEISIVQHEFNRLLAGQELCENQKKNLDTKILVEPVLKILAKTSSVDAQNFVCNLSLQSCIDLRLLSGDEAHEKESLLYKTLSTKTAAGEIVAADLFAHPIFNLEKLQQRKDVIKKMSDSPELLQKLEILILQFGERLKTYINILSSSPTSDTGCLLNKFFGLYWQEKSVFDLMPKKAEKTMQHLGIKKPVQSKAKKGWLRRLDQSDKVLGATFLACIMFFGIHWFAQAENLVKKLDDTFDNSWLRKIANFFRMQTEDERQRVVKATLDCFAQSPAIDENSFWHKWCDKNFLKQFFNPIFLKNIELGGFQAKQCGQAGDPRLFIYGLKFVNNFMRPVYLTVLPFFMVSNLFKEFKSYRDAILRALEEMWQMKELIDCFEQLLSGLEELFSSSEERKLLRSELKLIPEANKILSALDDQDFLKLVKAIKTSQNSCGYFLSHPGQFLRAYKQLYDFAPNFLNIVAAVGQIDAFVAIARLAKSPGYNFAKFNDAGLLSIQDCWDPKIGQKNCVKNSINFDKDSRGMIISGSNAAGKSSYMRTMMSAVILAQSTTLVPAASATICPFTDFFTFMNKKDDPAAGRSLHRVESDFVAAFIKNIATLNRSDRLLAAIDEMFSGTGPEDSFGLTCAIVEFIAQSKQSFAMVASHCPCIYVLEERTSNIFKNYKVTIKRDQFGRFLGYERKILPGYATPADSTAMDVASEAGIDQTIIASAKRFVQEKQENIVI